MQNSLDAAGIAIAAHYISGMSEDDLRSVGHEFFSTNMDGIVVNASQFEFDNEIPAEFAASASSSGGEDFITVRSGITHQGMIGSLNWKANRVSVVRIKKGPPACVLALDPHAPASVKIQGSTKVELNGCVIASNSGLQQFGLSWRSRIANDRMRQYRRRNVRHRRHLECQTGMWRTARKPIRVFRPARECRAHRITQAANRFRGGRPRRFRRVRIATKPFLGKLPYLPGVYVLRGGKINLGGNGSLVGAGVTIFLMEDANFSVNGNEIVQLSPPTSGPYAGITIYQERSNDNPLTINGASGSQVSGFVYAPGAHVFYAGNSATTGLGGCMRLVGKTIEMTGNCGYKVGLYGRTGWPIDVCWPIFVAASDRPERAFGYKGRLLPSLRLTPRSANCR